MTSFQCGRIDSKRSEDEEQSQYHADFTTDWTFRSGCATEIGERWPISQQWIVFTKYSFSFSSSRPRFRKDCDAKRMELMWTTPKLAKPVRARWLIETHPTFSSKKNMVRTSLFFKVEFRFFILIVYRSSIRSDVRTENNWWSLCYSNRNLWSLYETDIHLFLYLPNHSWLSLAFFLNNIASQINKLRIWILI